MKSGLAQRDMSQVCRYLTDLPDSLRLTGPNPAAGPGWIIDSGCPAGVVEPESWVSLDFDPAWLDRSPWESGNWDFPTFAEVAGRQAHSGDWHFIFLHLQPIYPAWDAPR